MRLKVPCEFFRHKLLVLNLRLIEMKIQFQNENVIIFESALFRTTCTLIIHENYILLIDPNWLPGEIDFIYNYIQNIASAKKKYLLFTHSDYDHIIGFGKFKDYTTIASHNFVINPKKETILEEIKTFDDQYYITRNYGIEYPRIDIEIKEDNKIELIENDTFIFLQAQGHNSDGIITFHKEKGILILGDYLSNIEFPYIYFSVKEYKNTLNKLEQFISRNNIQLLITGHGDATSDKKEMINRVDDSRSYISELEDSVKNKTAFNLKALFEKYKFKKVMTDFHEGNIKLLQTVI